MIRPTLSPRQMEILALMAIGRTNDEIGKVLGITMLTAKQHIAHMAVRMGSFSRMNMVWKAMQFGLLAPPKLLEGCALIGNRPEEVTDIIPDMEPPIPVYRWRDLELCIEKRELRIAGEVITVQTRALVLLKYLLEHPNRPHTRSVLLDACWGREVFVEERTVDVHISRVRKALGKYAVHLISDRLVKGYKFVMEAAP